MANLLSDDGSAWAVDDQRLVEITLLTDVMIEASSRSGRLTQAEIDEMLAHAPTVAEVKAPQGAVPHPRRERGIPARVS